MQDFFFLIILGFTCMLILFIKSISFTIMKRVLNVEISETNKDFINILMAYTGNFILTWALIEGMFI